MTIKIYSSFSPPFQITCSELQGPAAKCKFNICSQFYIFYQPNLLWNIKVTPDHETAGKSIVQLLLSL